MDKLRLELDELWPNGAQVKKSEQGQAYMAGLGYRCRHHRWQCRSVVVRVRAGCSSDAGGANRSGVLRVLYGAAWGRRIMHATPQHRPGFCHVDEIEIMREDRGVFSANVYLRVPPGGSGGELDIW